MTEHLSSQTTCVLSTRGEVGSWSMPVRYRNVSLNLDCLIPSWADVVLHRERSEPAMLVIQSRIPISGCWLQYLGDARWMNQVTEPAFFDRFLRNNHAQHLYDVLRITPRRVDLIDESRGWGVRENLDLR